jgi:tRNA1Val (adenine37-N6)-methyltransferase
MNVPVPLFPGERVDDLEVNGLCVIQHEDGYRFTADPVLLAYFCHAGYRDTAVDLGTGSGIIPILLAGKYGAAHVTGVEIQERLCHSAQRSVAMNGLTDQITIIHGDMREAASVLGVHKSTLVVCNPPYSHASDGKPNESRELAVCRHEVEIDLPGVVESAARLLRYGGRLCLIYRVERLPALFSILLAAKLQPKRLQLVSGRVGRIPNLALVEARAGGKPGLRLEETLFITDARGNETEQTKAIYGRQSAALKASVRSSASSVF